jgi:flagellar motor protein MotB
MSRIGLRTGRRRADLESLWLITFADLMVQLMAFFALAYSFTATDQEKFQAILRSLRKELGVATAQDLAGLKDAGNEGVLPGNVGLDPSRAADLERLLNERKAADGPEVGTRLRLVSFRPAVLFDEGGARLNSDNDLLLKRLAQLVLKYPGFQLVCEGHAAQDEKARGVTDALELSGLRAQACVRTLIALGVEPKILAAEAHGDSIPDGDSLSAEGRALQRRATFRFQRFSER